MIDYGSTDLTLAIAHHLLILLLAGILAFEIGVIRLNMKREDIVRVGRVDTWYGIIGRSDDRRRCILAGRIFAAKGWAYYSVNMFFWGEAGRPLPPSGSSRLRATVRIIRWRRALKQDAGFAPGAAADIHNVRRYLWAEAAFFCLHSRLRRGDGSRLRHVRALVYLVQTISVRKDDGGATMRKPAPRPKPKPPWKKRR